MASLCMYATDILNDMMLFAHRTPALTHHVWEEGCCAVDELGELVHLHEVPRVQQLLQVKQNDKGCDNM